MKETQEYDVVIIGAGLSGICAAYHIQDKCPEKKYLILEARAGMGGTWDLFKYPGIRSDSDMYTLGFSFSPWKNPKAIADGPDILRYIKETARKFGIDQHIRFRHKVKRARWASEQQCWTLEVQNGESAEPIEIQGKFIISCCGYYNYEEGHSPKFPNSEQFQGTIIHPQKWDTSLDYTEKNVVIIGSGATAVTLVPEMAKKANSVTMLQRSPSYIMNLPSKDVVANGLRKVLPEKTAHAMVRWKNITIGNTFYKACRRWPDRMSKLLKRGVKKSLGEHYNEQHFSPKYDPWDQRVCLIPDNDLFDSIKSGKSKIVTDTIKEFTATGIALDSGEHLDADIIVTATGLKVQIFGGITVRIDEDEIASGDLTAYKGVMFSGVPNLAVALGYTNASWTLKCELNCQFVGNLLVHMREQGHQVCTPRFDTNKFQIEPLLDFDAGYIKRANSILPKQGSAEPWKVYQNYFKDTKALKNTSFEDEFLEYS